MNPLIRGLLWRAAYEQERKEEEEKKQKGNGEEIAPVQLKVTEEEMKESMDREKKAGVFEWIWFISWGLLIPMLFFLFYGIVGLVVGLILFAIYLMIVYISVKPESERHGLEEKAGRLQDFVDSRTDKLNQLNRQAVDSVRRSVIRNIPGFRTQTPWKMVAASAFYVFTILVLLAAFQQGNYGLGLLITLVALLFVSGTQDEMS